MPETLGASLFVRLLYILLRASMRLGVFPVKITGREHWQELDKNRGVITTSNHETPMDVVYLNVWSERPAIFMCRKHILDFPVIGRFLAHIGFLPVEPHNAALNAATVRTMHQRLRAGRSMGIFPAGDEDTVIGEVIADFKTGAARLAIQAGVPLLPTGIRGTRRLMPLYNPDESCSRPIWTWVVLPFRRVEMAFGAPIYPTDDGTRTGRPLTNTKENALWLTNLLQSRIAGLAGLRIASSTLPA